MKADKLKLKTWKKLQELTMRKTGSWKTLWDLKNNNMQISKEKGEMKHFHVNVVKNLQDMDRTKYKKKENELLKIDMEKKR